MGMLPQVATTPPWIKLGNPDLEGEKTEDRFGDQLRQARPASCTQVHR